MNRGHHCAYSIVGLTIDEAHNYRQTIFQLKTRIEELQNIIDKNNFFISKVVANSLKIHDLIVPLVKKVEPMSLIDFIQNSMLNENSKKFYKSLFEKYIKYCHNKLNIHQFSDSDTCFLGQESSIYNPDTAFVFVTKVQNYHRTSIPKILNAFLFALRKVTKNPTLEFTYQLGQVLKPKPKHIVSFEEMCLFMEYLKQNFDFQTCLLFEILYRYGIRIGGIANIKVFNFHKKDDNSSYLHFPEKNQKICIKKLGPVLTARIERIIKEDSLEKNDYIFMPEFKEGNKSKRSHHFSLKLNPIIKNSKIFEDAEQRAVNVHMLRTTLAVDTFMERRVEKARKKLGHTQGSTTLYNYIKKDEYQLIQTDERIDFDHNGFRNVFDFDTIKEENKKKKVQKRKPKKEIIPLDEEAEEAESINSSDSEDSLYKDAFMYDHIPLTKHKKEEDQFLSKKRQRPKENLENEQKPKIVKEINLYEEFLNVHKKIKIDEKISLETLVLEGKPYEGKILNLFKKESWEFSNEVTCLSPNVNKVTFAANKSLSSIIFFNYESLLDLNEYLKSLENKVPAFIEILKSEGNTSKIVSRKEIKANCFLFMVSGTVGYESQVKKNFADSEIYKIPLFEVNDKKYNRFMYVSNKGNIGSFISVKQKITKGNNNLSLIKFVDSELKVQVGLVSNTKIKRGEAFTVNEEEILNI